MMTAFSFIIKKPITEEQYEAILKDIAIANEESVRLWTKMKKALNARVIRYTVGLLEFVKYMAMNADYFSRNDIIKGIKKGNDFVLVDIEDSFVELLDVGSSLGVNHIKKAINYVASRIGAEIDPNLYNREGFEKYIKRALTENGVDVI